MAVYNAVADLGWTPGADVSQRISDFFAGVPNAGNNNQVAAAGDTLYLDSATRFQLTLATSGNITLPANFTLSAVDGGGFDLQDGVTSGSGYYFTGSSGCYIYNLTVRANGGEAGDTGYVGNSPVPGTDHNYERFIEIPIGAHDAILRNCDFEGQIEIWVRLSGGGDSAGLNDVLIEGCRFYGAKYTVWMVGKVYRPIVRKCYFERSMQDCVKAAMLFVSTPGGWVGPLSDGVVVNSKGNHFKDQNREAWDTTGGMYKFIFEDDITNRAYMDIKIPIKELADPTNDLPNVWNPYVKYGCNEVIVRRAHFIGTGRGRYIICTGDTRYDSGEVIGISDYNRVAPRDLTFEDCIWERNSGDNQELFFMKQENGLVVRRLDIRGKTGDTESTIVDADWTTKLGNNGYPPSGWSPPTARDVSGTTTSATNTSPLPTLEWNKVAESGGPTTGAVFTSSSGSMLLIGGKPLIL